MQVRKPKLSFKNFYSSSEKMEGKKEEREGRKEKRGREREGKEEGREDLNTKMATSCYPSCRSVSVFLNQT